MVDFIQFPSIYRPYTCKNLIRLGNNNDGGYLVNELDVKRTDNLIGFGVGTDISFENNFVKINNCDVYVYDQNINVDINPEFNVIKQNVLTDIKLEEVFNNKHKIFLKCDIDGDEYNILNFLINYCHLFTGLVMEVHDIEILENNFKIMDFIAKFRLPLVHAHVNNHQYYIMPDKTIIPSVLELTFSSSDNIYYDENIQLPHKLDMPNKVGEFDFKMTFF